MRRDYVLSCCSTVDLTAEHLAAREIAWLPFHFFLDNVEHADDLGQSLPPAAFYQAMVDGADTRTSQINTEEYVNHFTPFLKQGKDILHVCLSSGISGTINSALNAQAILAEEFPQRRILIVDSLCASSGLGLLMDQLADLRDGGMELDELRDWAEENRCRLHHWFFSSDLTFFVKGGRISRSSGFVGTLLGICPLLNVDREGKLIPREKIRSKKKVIQTIVQRMKEHARDGLDYDGKCYLCYSACEEDARAVAALVEEAFPRLKGPVELYSIGPTIGCHTGPGTVALFFWGDERGD